MPCAGIEACTCLAGLLGWSDVQGLTECGSCRALNRIQSTIFEKAFSSNENILVCAPTGAGKTNIAMLTVLHEIAANMSDGIIQASQSVPAALCALVEQMASPAVCGAPSSRRCTSCLSS